MAILNYTTTIDPIKTISEITTCLVRHGANKIVTDYDSDGHPVGLTFWIQHQGQVVYFALPCNWAGVLRALEKDAKVPGKLKTKEQAMRVAWRIIKEWVVAQMAIIEAQVASLTEVFLPYAITNTGKTVYQAFETGSSGLLLKSGNR